jgi:tetratricopeptide (TPR) repeat protein
MRLWKPALMAALVFLLFSCVTDPHFKDYRDGLFYGSEALERGEYRTALDQFVKAGRGEPDKPLPFALAGHAAYQLGDLSAAGGYLAEAQRLDPREQTESYVIVKGFQALIAFKQGRRSEGMAALGEYIKFYRNSYPDSSYDEVKRMYESGNINAPGLESLILHQMTRYEKEIFLVF